MRNNEDAGKIAFANITVRHATLVSKRNFDDTKQALEAEMPMLDYTWRDKLQAGDVAGGQAALEQLPVFNIFGTPFDHGLILTIYGMQKRALVYSVGNPYTASMMTKHKLQTSIYGPVTLLLIEYEDGRVMFEWDTPDTTWGRFHDPDVGLIAGKAAPKLQETLERAAGW